MARPGARTSPRPGLLALPTASGGLALRAGCGSCLPVRRQGLLGGGGAARLTRLSGRLALGALRTARSHRRAGADVDGLSRGRAGNEAVAVAAEPVLDLRATRFSTEDDPGGPDPAAVALLKNTHPQVAVEEDGESRRHCCLQVRRSGPDDAGFLTGARRRARAGCHPDFLPGSAIRAPGTDGVILSLLAQRRGGCLESARVKAFAHAGAHGSFVTVDDAIVVRRATVPDVSALVALREEMFRMTGTAMTDGRWRSNARRWFLERIRNPIYGIFVVQADREVVACAMGAVRDAAPSPEVPDGRDVLVSNVCTLPAHRGHGHGRRAFEAVMRWAASTGIGRAELMATEAGQGMYEQTGFTLNKFPAMRADLRAC